MTIRVGDGVRLTGITGAEWMTRWNGRYATVDSIYDSGDGPVYTVRTGKGNVTATLHLPAENLGMINNSEMWA